MRFLLPHCRALVITAFTVKVVCRAYLPHCRALVITAFMRLQRGLNFLHCPCFSDIFRGDRGRKASIHACATAKFERNRKVDLTNAN